MKRRTVLRSMGLLAGAVASPALVRAAASPAADAVADLLGQTYPDTEGQPQALAQWKDRPMLINFWATWCAPCVKEMPELDTLHKHHPGVQFMGLAVDTPTNVLKFVAKVPVSYTVLVSGLGSIQLMRKLGNSAGVLPFTIALDTDGRIKKQIIGTVDGNVLNQVLADIVVRPQ